MKDPQEELIQRSASEFIVLLQGLAKALSLYDPNNAAVARICQALIALVEGHFAQDGGALEVQLLDEEFFVNGHLLRVDPALYERASRLAVVLRPLGVGSVKVSGPLAAGDLESFVVDLARSVRSGKSGLSLEPYGALELGDTSARSVASYRFEPDQLAVWLYTALIDITEQLYFQHDLGRSPSLVPLKRALQLVIDNMADHSAVYQLLTAMNRPHRQVPRPLQRSAVAVESIGFGHFMGLDPDRLLTLGLAAILGGLTTGKDPDEAVRPVFGFPGLGVAAIPQALVLHDARAHRLGKRASAAGRLLAMVETYVAAVTPGEGGSVVSAPKAIRSLIGGGLRWVDPKLARAFAAYKGKVPIGALVALEDRGHAVVVGRRSASDHRPVVLLIGERKRLGERIDLARATGLSIAGVPTPLEARLDLLKLDGTEVSEASLPDADKKAA